MIVIVKIADPLKMMLTTNTVPQKKCPTTCVHSLVSVTYQLLQKNQFDVQAQGLVVVHAKDG